MIFLLIEKLVIDKALFILYVICINICINNFKNIFDIVFYYMHLILKKKKGRENSFTYCNERVQFECRTDERRQK